LIQTVIKHRYFVVRILKTENSLLLFDFQDNRYLLLLESRNTDPTTPAPLLASNISNEPELNYLVI
jgi:hypothetical protein